MKFKVQYTSVEYISGSQKQLLPQLSCDYSQNGLIVVTARMLSVTDLKSRTVTVTVLHTCSAQLCTTLHSASLDAAFAKLAEFSLML